MLYTITITSVNRFKELEWAQTIESTTKGGATRKANNLIRSCGFDLSQVKISKTVVSQTKSDWVI